MVLLLLLLLTLNHTQVWRAEEKGFLWSGFVMNSVEERSGNGWVTHPMSKTKGGVLIFPLILFWHTLKLTEH